LFFRAARVEEAGRKEKRTMNRKTKIPKMGRFKKIPENDD